MSVHVDIPIRLIVDADAVAHRQDDVDDALREAVGRALQNAYATAVAPRGGYAELLLDPPTFNWVGNDAFLIDDDQREVFQQHTRSVIQQAIDESAIPDHTRVGADAPMPMPPDPSEVIDPRRMLKPFDLYQIPRYDDEGDDTAVEVETDENTGEGTPLEEALIGVWSWLSVSYGEIRENGGTGNLTEFGHFQYEQAINRFGAPASEWRGLIFRDEHNLIIDFNNPTGQEGAFYFLKIPLEDFQQYVFVNAEANPPFRRVNQLPYPGATTLKKHGPFSPSQRVEVVERFMLNGIREQFEQTLMGAKSRTVTQDEHQAHLQRLIDAEVERRSNDLPNAEFNLYELQIGEYRHLVQEPTSRAPDFTLPETVHLVPITIVELIALGDDSGEGEFGSGAGGGKSGGATGGYGSKDAQGTGQEGEQSGFIDVGGEGEGGTLMYPVVGGGLMLLSTSCFEDEPKLEDLGEDANLIREEMHKLMHLLQIPEMDCAGRFAINAAKILGARATVIGIYAGQEEGFTEPVSDTTGGTGNLGNINFVPVVSPAIQFLRHLSSIVPDIDRYFRLVTAIYDKPAHAGKFGGHYTNNVTSWMLRFYYQMNQSMQDSVGHIFTRTCQVLLMQLLRSSAKSINGRLQNLGEYSRVFEQVLLPQLRSVQDMIELREMLQRNQSAVSWRNQLRSIESRTESIATDWVSANRQLLDAFIASNTAESEEDARRGEIVVENGEVKIYDGTGRLWTLQGLERAIQIKRGFVESGDPLVKQLADLDDALDRFEGDSVDIAYELLMMLYDMDQNNKSQQEKVRSDHMYAFEMGQITENLEQRTIPYTTYALQGIHLMAHEMIGEFFRGDRWYAMGVEYIFDVTMGLRGLFTFFEFGIVILLSVVCPPLGAAVGAGFSLYHYSEALEKEELYESLIDPELVLSRAQIEAEMFAAQLGVALSFIPEAGGIIARGLGVGVRAGSRAAGELIEEGAEQLARSGGQSLGRAVVGRLSREAAESLKHGVAYAFAREIITDQVMDAVIGKLMIEPIVQSIYQEYMTVGPGLHGRGLISPSAGDRPNNSVTDSSQRPDGSTVTRHADGSVSIIFRQDGSSADPDGED